MATASSLPDVTLCTTTPTPQHITPSNATDMKFLKNNNPSDRIFTANIDHLNESLYKIDKFMRLTKDIDDIKRQQCVGQDIQRKLSLKEQWLKNTPSPAPSVFSRGSSMYGSTQSVNSLTSLNSHGSEAAKPPGYVKPLIDVTEIKSSLPLKEEVESKFISQAKIVVPSSSDVKTTTEAELFGTITSSTDKLHNSSVNIANDDGDEDDLSYLDALELNDAEIRELTQPIRETSAIDFFHKKSKEENDLKQALKKIELKNFADTFSHIQSQFVGPKVSTDTARDLSKFFPKKEEPIPTGAVNKTQKELKDVDLAKYFAPSPVQQRKTFGFDKQMASKVTRRSAANDGGKPRSTAGAKEKEFNMFDSQLDGAMDLKRSVKTAPAKHIKPKSTGKVKAVKMKPSIVKPPQTVTKSKVSSDSNSKSEACEFDESSFDKLFGAQTSATDVMRIRNESETSSTSFDKMFKSEDLEPSEVDHGFEQVAQLSGIKLKPQKNKPTHMSPPPLKTRVFDAQSLEKFFSETSDSKNLTYHRPPPTWCKKPAATKWEDLESKMISAMPLSLQAQIRELELQIANDEPLSILEDFEFDCNSHMAPVLTTMELQDNSKLAKKKTTVVLSTKSKARAKKIKPDIDEKSSQVEEVSNKKVITGKKKTNGVRKVLAASKNVGYSQGHYATMDELEEKVLMELSSSQPVLSPANRSFIDMPQEGVSVPKALQSRPQQEVQLNDVPHEGFMLSVTNNENISHKIVPIKPLRRSISANRVATPMPERKESNPIIELYHISKVMSTSSAESHGSTESGTSGDVPAPHEPPPPPVSKLVFKYKPLTSVGRDIIDYPLYPKPLKVASSERAEISHIHDPVTNNLDQPSIQKTTLNRTSREASPLQDRRQLVVNDEPVRPGRRQRIEADATDRLLERSQAIHNRKQDFMNEKLSRSNPYLRRAQENQSRESLLSSGSSDLFLPAGSYTTSKDFVEYRRSEAVPRFNAEKTYSMSSTSYSNPRTSHTPIKRLSFSKPEKTMCDYRTDDYRNPIVDRIARTYPTPSSSTYSKVSNVTLSPSSQSTNDSAATPLSRFNIFKRSPVAARKSRNGKKDGCIIS